MDFTGRLKLWTCAGALLPMERPPGGFVRTGLHIYIHIDNSGVVAVSGSEENSGTSLGVAAGGLQALPA